MLTSKLQDLLPSEEDIRFYEKNGWYISKKIFTDEAIDTAIKGANEFYNGERDFTILNKEGIADDWQEGTILRNNEFVTLQKKELQQLGHHEIIGAIAAKLSRTNGIRLFADSLINKAPAKDKGIVGWHTDKAYWPTCTSEDMLTAWIPFQNCTEDMGTLTHIDESQQWKKEKELKKFYSFNNQNLSDLKSYLNLNKPAHKTSLMLLQKGQVSFHNCNIIHSSSPNLSTKNRMALAIHLQNTENRYKKAYKENGEEIVIGYDLLCKKDENGLPDYKDENLFPVIWPTNQK